jgi:thiosulfate dehydrogenase
MKRSFGALLLLAACSTETEQQVVPGTALDHGRALFSDPTASPSPLNVFSCSTCHRADADAADTRILPGAVMAGAVDRTSFWGGREIDLLRSVNACRTFFMNAQQPWTVDDEEAKVMYLFLDSLPKTEPDAQPMTVPPVVDDVPAGNADAGGGIYARSCQVCHGAIHSGEGRLAERIISLPDEELAFLDSYGFDATEKRVTFIEKVRHGGFLGLYGNMPLYSTEVLSDAELGDLLAYLGLY